MSELQLQWTWIPFSVLQGAVLHLISAWLKRYLFTLKWFLPCLSGAAENDCAHFECWESYDQTANSGPLSVYLTLCYMCSIPLLGVSKIAPVLTFLLLFSSAASHKSANDLGLTFSKRSYPAYTQTKAEGYKAPYSPTRIHSPKHKVSNPGL